MCNTIVFVLIIISGRFCVHTVLDNKP